MDPNKILQEMNEAVTALRDGLEGKASAEEINKIHDAIDKIELQQKQLSTAPIQTKEGGFTEAELKHAKAFNEFMRLGEKGVSSETDQIIREFEMQHKAMSGTTAADGGNLIPQILSMMIIDKVKETSPIRQYAEVITIGIGNELQTPKKSRAAAGGWIGEAAARPATDSPQFDLLKNPVMEMYANCPITQSLLEDQAFSLEAYIANDISTTFAQLEGTAFVNGDGTLKPSGLLLGAGTGTGFAIVKSGVATDFTLDNVLDLEYALSSKYIGNARWLAARQTIRKLRGFKNTSGDYLWQPSLILGQPATFDGFAIVETPDMPVAGADAVPIAFGDIRQGYQIVDKRGMAMLRDPYSNKPFVNFYATMRVGGKVSDTAAMKVLQCKV